MPIATPQGTLDFKSVDKVTFVGASSNTVIDTTTGSLGVGVGVGGPTSNLHVVGNTRLEGDINMLHTANTASIKLNSNVVTEFPRSKKLVKYPRVLMTSNSSGGYVAGRSTVYTNSAGLEAWKMFDGDSSTYWHSENSTGYWNTDGTYDGTSQLITGHLGEWVTLQLPTNEKVQLHGIRVFPRGLRTGGWSAGAAPKDVVVVGSNNGSSWNVIATTTLVNYSFGTNPSLSTPAGEENVPATFDFEAMEHYQYVGLIIKSLYSGNHVHASISALEFFGVPEYDPEAHGTDVVVKSVPNVPNTDWLEVYYDAKDLADGAVSTAAGAITALGGTTNNGTAVGDPQVSNGAFVFDGNGDYIYTTSTATLSNHTASMWIKFEEFSGWEAAYAIRPASLDRNNAFLYANSDGRFRLEALGNTGPYKDFTYDFELGKWVHLTVLFEHTGLIHSKIYVDNVELVPTGTVRNITDNITITGATTIHIGSEPSYYFTGSVANFRLFNRILTSDEIYQLYAYQKEEFGHSTNNLTLKAGRLGIGTSEPRAMLDVRGDVHISGTLRKTRAQMFAVSSGSMATNNTNWVTLAPFGEIWTAYSENPLFSVHITGDYTDTTGRACLFRLLVRNERTGEVVYFPNSSGWIKYLYIDHSRLDGHGYNGIMSNLTPGDSYTSGLQVNGNHLSSYYQWHSNYGTLTGIVWD